MYLDIFIIQCCYVKKRCEGVKNVKDGYYIIISVIVNVRSIDTSVIVEYGRRRQGIAF